MIEEYLPQTNESATVSEAKIFLQTEQGLKFCELNKALNIASMYGSRARNRKSGCPRR